MGKVTKEVALHEFEQWAEACEIDTGTEDLNTKDLAAFESFRAKFVSRLQRGTLTVSEDGELTFTPRGLDETLTFKEPTGAILSARLKTDTDVQATRRVLAAWAGVEPKTFADMTLKDFNFCGELLAFFVDS